MNSPEESPAREVAAPSDATAANGELVSVGSPPPPTVPPKSPTAVSKQLPTLRADLKRFRNPRLNTQLVGARTFTHIYRHTHQSDAYTSDYHRHAVHLLPGWVVPEPWKCWLTKKYPAWV